MFASFARRALQSTRASIRHGSSHSGHHHHGAPKKQVDLNIPLEGVEARWSSLAPEQQEVVVKQAQELMKGDWRKLSLAQKNTRRPPPLSS